MKKLLLIVSLLLTTILCKSQGLGFYLNGIIGVSDTSYNFGYVFYPNKLAPLIAKDSSLFKINFLRTEFSQLNSSKNDGIPSSIGWFNNNGDLKRSPISSLTLTSSQITTALGNTPIFNEVDASITNEIELPSQSGNAGRTLNTNGTSVSWGKRQESYSGTSNGSGNYTVTFGTAYSVAPNIVIGLKGSTNEQSYDNVTISTTGFTIHIYQRTYVLGLAQASTNVSGASVDVLITEK